MSPRMEIRIDDLRGPEIAAILEEHLQSMRQHSPPESVHALDLDKLRKPEITFWTAWDGKELLGCGALKELDPAYGEIKSMRTATRHLRKGVALSIMQVILAEAKNALTSGSAWRRVQWRHLHRHVRCMLGLASSCAGRFRVMLKTNTVFS